HRDPDIHEDVRPQDDMGHSAVAEVLLGGGFGLHEGAGARRVGAEGGDEDEAAHAGGGRDVDQVAVAGPVHALHGVLAAAGRGIRGGDDGLDAAAGGGE